MNVTTKFSDWLENKLSEEISEETKRERRRHFLVQWAHGFGVTFVTLVLINWLHWRPVWVLLLIVAPAAIAINYAIYRRFPPWWQYALALTASLALAMLLPRSWW